MSSSEDETGVKLIIIIIIIIITIQNPVESVIRYYPECGGI